MARLKTTLTFTVIATAAGLSTWILHAHGGVLHSIKDSLLGIHEKVVEIQEADEKVSRLTTENETLRRFSEEVQFQCASEKAKKSTKENATELTQETGSEIGLVLAGIQYTPPTQLLPKQLYVLGVSYYEQREFEKAAVILSYLVSMQRMPEFKTARNLLLTGMAWYQLEHFKLAQEYFNRVVQKHEGAANTDELAQSRLWLALLAKKTQQNKVSQQWLRELIEKNPFSKEAKWVNTAERTPSSSSH